MNLRFAREEDLQAVREIYEEAFPIAERKDLATVLSPRYETRLAEEQGEICGLCAVLKVNNVALIDYLAVKADKRGSGIGDRMLTAVVKAYEDAREIFLEIETPNRGENERENALRERRRQFYFRHGFFEAGLSVQLNGVDMIVLRKKGAGDVKADYLGVYTGAFGDCSDSRYRARITGTYLPADGAQKKA